MGIGGGGWGGGREGPVVGEGCVNLVSRENYYFYRKMKRNKVCK